MTKKDWFGTIIWFFTGLSISVLLLFIILNLVPSHHDNQQHKEILRYLTPAVETDITFLTEDEQSHLFDVKILFYACIIIALIGGFVAWKKKLCTTRYAGYGLLVLVAFFGGMALQGFSSAFIRFHQIFFPQGGWQFPADSVLITLYPETYFLNVALILLGCVLFVAGYLIGNFKIPGIKE